MGLPRSNKNRGVAAEVVVVIVVVAVIITAIVTDTATSSSYSNNMSSCNNSKATVVLAVGIATYANVVGIATVAIGIAAFVFTAFAVFAIVAFADLEAMLNTDCDQASVGDMSYTN